VSTRSGDAEIAAFRRLLVGLLGLKDLPEGITGDLSDLLGTLEQGAALLRRLMECTDKEQAARDLLGVELLLADDLRMIARDLLPALRKVLKEVYPDDGDDDEGDEP
jgi:hypothetical protein